MLFTLDFVAKSIPYDRTVYALRYEGLPMPERAHDSDGFAHNAHGAGALPDGECQSQGQDNSHCAASQRWKRTFARLADICPHGQRASSARLRPPFRPPDLLLRMAARGAPARAAALGMDGSAIVCLESCYKRLTTKALPFLALASDLPADLLTYFFR